MKFVQIIQLLLTLACTIAAVLAYDAPYGYGRIGSYSDGRPTMVFLFFHLPKYSFDKVNIYHLAHHLDIHTALANYGTNYNGRINLSWNNNDKDVNNPWIIANDLELPENAPYSEFYVSFIAAQQPVCAYSDLEFLFVLHGSEGEQLFPVTISARHWGQLWTSSFPTCSFTTSSTITPSSSTTSSTITTSSSTTSSYPGPIPSFTP